VDYSSQLSDYGDDITRYRTVDPDSDGCFDNYAIFENVVAWTPDCGTGQRADAYIKQLKFAVSE
jgi:hypothetical protein